MSSPITSEDFDNQSHTGSVCSIFSQKLLNNDKMKLLLSYLFTDAGLINAEFATDLMELLEPVGSLMQAPVDLGLDARAWLKCEGQAVSRTTYARLFAKLGTTFGIGDGSTTFNLPDLRDRFLIGSSGTRAIASTGGEETVQLVFSDLPDHDHLAATYFTAAPNENDMGFPTAATTTVDSTPITFLHTNSSGGSNPGDQTDFNVKTLGMLNNLVVVDDNEPTSHNNIPPYFAVVMYIKANHLIAEQIL